MIPFSAVLSPEAVKHAGAGEVPRRKGFFGGSSQGPADDITLTRAEREAFYLSGKLSEIDPVEEAGLRPLFSAARTYF